MVSVEVVISDSCCNLVGFASVYDVCKGPPRQPLSVGGGVSTYVGQSVEAWWCFVGCSRAEGKQRTNPTSTPPQDKERLYQEDSHG